MTTYLGDFPVGATVRHKWTTNAGDGSSITRATNGAIRIYKNSSTTERSSSAGITDTEDFDATTGIHDLAIDTSNNTDAGFYAAGNEYQAVLVGAIIDGKTVNAVLCSWSIERAGGVLALLKARLPNAAPGAAGGLIVNGANTGDVSVASLTIDGELSVLDGAVISTSTSGKSAVTLTPSGDGHGIHIDADAGEGDGIYIEAGDAGVEIVGAYGIYATAGSDAFTMISTAGSAMVVSNTESASLPAVLIEGGGGGAVHYYDYVYFADGIAIERSVAGSGPGLSITGANGDASDASPQPGVLITSGFVDEMAEESSPEVALRIQGEGGGASIGCMADGHGLTLHGGTAGGSGLHVITLGGPSRTAVGVAMGVQYGQPIAGFMFRMYDTNGDPAPELTVAATRSLDGGAFGACANTPTEVENGWYTIDLANTDMQGAVVALNFAATGARDTSITLLTEPGPL